MTSLDRLLTVQDLAEYLDVPIATIYAWRYRRQGPPGFRVGKHLRYRPCDIEQWIADQIEDSNPVSSATSSPGRAIRTDRHPPRQIS